MSKKTLLLIGLGVTAFIVLIVFLVEITEVDNRCDEGNIRYDRVLVPAGKAFVWQERFYDSQGRCQP